jgi:3-oxoacid CoA-transferase subunit A
LEGDTAGNLILKELQETLIRACQEPLRSPLLKWRLVEAGTLDPNQIHIPGIFVQRIFQGSKYEKELSNVQ